MSATQPDPMAAQRRPGLWQGRHALLLRREFWEHRALWLAPAVVALLMVVVPLFGNYRVSIGGRETVRPDLPPRLLEQFGAMTLFGVAMVLGVVAGVVSIAYLLDNLFAEEGRKVVLFSEWKRMLDLIEPLLVERGLGYVRLDGSVPQKKRLQLVQEFQNSEDCRLFITTNAGSTGLNLQAANTVINVDLPWNPAVLEQRIARAHRMGQQQPVQVYLLVTEDTLEEKLLVTLSSKHDLALAALDTESGIDRVDVASGMEELKRRLEVLLGAKPEAARDESLSRQQQEQAQRLVYQQRVAAAGGELLGAAFQFLGELIEDGTRNTQPPADLTQNLRNRLAACVQEDEAGRQQLTVTLPNRSSLDRLAESLAKLLAAGGA